MKTLITNYSFNASAKTITFNGYSTISLDSILLVTNVTDNVIIYNFSDPALGGTVANNVLTLTYNTTTMSNTDRLQIYYDDSAVQPANASNQSRMEDAIDAIYYLAKNLEWLNGARIPITGTSGVTVALPTVTDYRSNISNISSLTQLNYLIYLGNTSAGGSGTTGRPFFDPAAMFVYQANAAISLSTINNIVVS